VVAIGGKSLFYLPLPLDGFTELNFSFNNPFPSFEFGSTYIEFAKGERR
jgi:hypothetical protein